MDPKASVLTTTLHEAYLNEHIYTVMLAPCKLIVIGSIVLQVNVRIVAEVRASVLGL